MSDYSKVKLQTPQQLADIQSGSVVIDGKYSPGRTYTLVFHDEKVNARCTSWFQDSCIKSSFVKIDS